jgi:peptidoglycan pentaglycine glycine transferase (the first glycine)
MKITTITDRAQWEEFINEHSITTFMQSWAWGEFEISCNHQVFRFFVADETRVIAAIQAILIKSKRGIFLYVPHGPILHTDLVPELSWTDTADSSLSQFGVIEKTLKSMHRELLRIAREHNCTFMRINSSLPKNTHLEEIFQDFGYHIAPIYLTSENASVLGLNDASPDQLLANMRKTTRYLIHKAEKEEVTVEIDTSGVKIQDFMKLYTITTEREKFVGFGENYIKSEFEAYGQHGNAVILNAYHRAQNLATALILFTKNSAFYHQGASNHPKVPAPYLLQWRAIQLAIERGCKYYNFWGTYIPGRTPKSWQGLSLFKLGFGTRVWNYLPTYDYPLKSSYYLTNIYERYIRLRRGV